MALRIALGGTLAQPNMRAVNLLSILIGMLALLPALLAFLPLFGWMYWLIVPVALVGFLVGLLSSKRTGRTLNLLVIVVGILRLMLGHGML